ncbi:MAG TPA: DUF3088 family protein [Caulobacteraceae bacterium]
MKDTLFLMQPGFFNAQLGPLYCGDSAAVEGMLSFFPELREIIDVRYVAFPRPRMPLVDILSEDHQSIPVLVLAPDRQVKDGGVMPDKARGHRFLDNEKVIRRYLSSQYGFPRAG